MESVELEAVELDNQRNPQFGSSNAPEPGLKLNMVTTDEGFDELKPHWQELALKTDTTIFMTHEWAKTWWNNFGRNNQRKLSILAIWDDQELVGLAPFYIGYSLIGNKRIETRLQIIGSGGSPNEQLGYMDDYGISDFLDILVLEEYREHVADLLCKIILSNSFKADVLNFHQARNDSYIMNYLYPKLQNTDLELSLEHTDTCPYIDVENTKSFNAYLKSLRSSARRRMRQSLKAMDPDKKGILELKELKSRDEVERAVDTMIHLHQDRWNRIGFPGVFYDKRFISFFRETVDYAYKNGWLWFKEIKDDEGVCAARMLLHYNGRFYDYISGFNDLRKSSKYRPGIGLLVEAVRDAINSKAKTVELLRGEEGYKYDFTDKNFKNWKLSVKLENNNSKVEESLSKASKMLALFYKRSTRELRLMNVQKLQHGFLKMIPEYISFRWNSLRLKREN